MADYQIGDKEFAKYEAWLQKEDKAMGTRLKYQRDVRSLQKWLRGRAVNQELLNGWRAALSLRRGMRQERYFDQHGSVQCECGDQVRREDLSAQYLHGPESGTVGLGGGQDARGVQLGEDPGQHLMR